jgi:hypothetical protein
MPKSTPTCDSIINLMFALLGLGGMRSYDKSKGAA